MAQEASISVPELRPGPIIPLYAYQTAYIRDKSRLKGWVKSRQIGGSFAATLEIVLDALETGQDWNLMSRSQRQAEKLLLKAARHVRAINQYVVGVLRQPAIVSEKDIGSQKIQLVNGVAIEAMPCDPDTTTGDTCNWLLDEFSLFPKSDQVFGVIKPSIMHGKKIRVLSTPRGRLHKFYDLWRRWEQLGATCGWSWHKVTIEDAVAGGLVIRDENDRPVGLATFKAQEIADIGLELFLQEYMCVFSDKLIAFLTYDTIIACQSANLPLVRQVESLAACGRDLSLGIDVGRKHDLSVGWVTSKTGDTYTTEGIFVLDRMPFEEQRRVFSSLLKLPNMIGSCIDQQGIGMQLSEELEYAFPGKVERVSFTNTNKAEMAYRLKVAMQAGNFWMPTDPAIVEDFESVERDITESGLVRIAAPRSASGHADRFWAACLAVHCAATHRPYELVMAV